MAMRRKLRLAGACLMAAACFMAGGAPALAGDITLYEGSYCDEARLAHYDSQRNYNDYCKRRGSVCHKNNDEARSVLIRKSNRAPFYMALMDSDQDRLEPFTKAPDRTSVGYTLKINRPFRDDVLILIIDPRKLPANECVTIGSYGATYGVRRPGINAQPFYRNGLAGKVSKVVIGR